MSDKDKDDIRELFAILRADIRCFIEDSGPLLWFALLMCVVEVVLVLYT